MKQQINFTADFKHLCLGRAVPYEGNKGIKEMAEEVVNQTWHLIKNCGRLTVRVSKPPIL